MGHHSLTISRTIQYVSGSKQNQLKKNTLPFSNFLNEVEAGRVVEVQIQGNNISGTLADGKSFKTFSQTIQN